MRPTLLAALVASASLAPAQAVDRFLSGPGALAFVGAGLLREGGDRSYRVGDAVLTSVAASELLKRITHQRRPDGTTFDSFPRAKIYLTNHVDVSPYVLGFCSQSSTRLRHN